MKLTAGDMHMLPAEIKHSVNDWSRNLEMIEITHPAAYKSIELTAKQVAALR